MQEHESSLNRHAKPEDPAEIFRRLEKSFAANLAGALAKQTEIIARVELKARCICSIGGILFRNEAVSPSQKDIAAVYDEIFADCICSIYLAGLGLDTSAQVVLRRVLELGVAVVFLWDLPHAYWGWKAHDEDLNFTEMIEHLSSPAYLTYMGSLSGGPPAANLFDIGLARKEYRALSNTVHGKIGTFETALVDRFKHSDQDWSCHLGRVERVEDLVIELSEKRFPKVREQLMSCQPQLARIR